MQFNIIKDPIRLLYHDIARQFSSFNSEAPEQGQLSTEFLLASDKQGSEAPA